jgi:hypothetical protein
VAFPTGPYRAGQTIEDRCRACKVDRLHTIIVVAPDGRPWRVQCDYCGSQHAFRGGGTMDAEDAPRPRASAAPPARDALALVSPRECADPPFTVEVPMHGPVELESLLRRIIREESGLTPVAPAERWRGGTLVVRPGTPGVQEKSWPLETFFHKIVMIRNRLRTLEQQVNALEIPADQKVKLQGYITGCYGSLTSFNVLFADERDQFKGSGD